MESLLPNTVFEQCGSRERDKREEKPEWGHREKWCFTTQTTVSASNYFQWKVAKPCMKNC